MSGLFIWVGLGGLILGVVNLVRPLGLLWIETRTQAGLLAVASLVVIVAGGGLSPTEDGPGPSAAPPRTLPATTVTSLVQDTTTVTVTVASTTTTRGAETTTSTTPEPTTTTVGVEALALELLATIPIELETPSGYLRELFPHWSDADGDRCDTREEVLIRDATGTAQVGPSCAVTSGVWFSVYEGVWLDRAVQLEIDHVVALKEAWDSGAREWETPRREAFANDLQDPHSLIAVSSSSNQAKGEADPSNWLPPNPDDRCRYIVAWVIVKARWELSMDESEHGRIQNLLEGPCEGATLIDGVPARPTPPSTTTTSSTSTTPVPGESAVMITNVVYDGPGNDVVYNDSEHVIVHNQGPGSADVGGWWLTDLADHQIVIPFPYSIPPGGTLRVYTGPGDSTATRYFAGLGQAIWNNSGGDTASLVDPSGVTVDTYSYSS